MSFVVALILGFGAGYWLDGVLDTTTMIAFRQYSTAELDGVKREGAPLALCEVPSTFAIINAL